MVVKELHEAVILMVDDERANLDLLESCLADEGYRNLHGTTDPREVASMFERLRPDLVLLDLHMPWLDGFAVLRQIAERVSQEEYLPILVLTADVTEATKQRALSGGAKDFLTKPLDLTETILRIRNLLETRILHLHQRLARRAAEDAGRRAMFLSEASRLLASSFDYHTTLSVLCRTAVPHIADYCVVDVLDEDGGISRVGLAHVDPAKESMLREMSHYEPGILPAQHPAMTALTEGRRTLAQEITPDMVGAVVANDEHRQIIEQLGPKSLIAVPLHAAGRIHGALVLVQSESDRRFEVEDLELAGELARRAALTIENARLFQQAQQATRARDEMLAIVAHDLRNPLSAVTMASTMLLEDNPSDSQRRWADIVGRAAKRMQTLIEDLLEARRIESGKLHVELQAQEVGPLVRESVTLLAPIANARSISLAAELPGSLPLVMMDGPRILQVISNLVGNAVKFTPEGGSVVISCERLGDEVRFAVSDTGPGIPREQIPHVFRRFWQASDSDSRGIGLGLSIARGITELHHGRIWVESEVGHGATFYFTLPVAGAASSPAPEPPLSHAGEGLVSEVRASQT